MSEPPHTFTHRALKTKAKARGTKWTEGSARIRTLQRQQQQQPSLIPSPPTHTRAGVFFCSRSRQLPPPTHTGARAPRKTTYRTTRHESTHTHTHRLSQPREFSRRHFLISLHYTRPGASASSAAAACVCRMYVLCTRVRTPRRAYRRGFFFSLSISLSLFLLCLFLLFRFSVCTYTRALLSVYSVFLLLYLLSMRSYPQIQIHTHARYTTHRRPACCEQRGKKVCDVASSRARAEYFILYRCVRRLMLVWCYIDRKRGGRKVSLELREKMSSSCGLLQ